MSRIRSFTVGATLLGAFTLLISLPSESQAGTCSSRKAYRTHSYYPSNRIVFSYRSGHSNHRSRVVYSNGHRRVKHSNYRYYPDRCTIRDVQYALRQAGYYRGIISGRIGRLTRRAITNYQHDNGLCVTGKVDNQLLCSLGIYARGD